MKKIVVILALAFSIQSQAFGIMKKPKIKHLLEYFEGIKKRGCYGDEYLQFNEGQRYQFFGLFNDAVNNGKLLEFLEGCVNELKKIRKEHPDQYQDVDQ